MSVSWNKPCCHVEQMEHKKYFPILLTLKSRASCRNFWENKKKPSSSVLKLWVARIGSLVEKSSRPYRVSYYSNTREKTERERETRLSSEQVRIVRRDFAIFFFFSCYYHCYHRRCHRVYRYRLIYRGSFSCFFFFLLFRHVENPILHSIRCCANEWIWFFFLGLFFVGETLK